MLRILKKYRLIVVALIIIGIIVIYRFQSFSAPAQQRTNRYTVKKQKVKETLSLSGSVDAEEHAVLRFQSSGRLSWVGVKEGDRVNKYQTIASLDQRELQRNLKKYLNTYVQERLDYDTTKEEKDIKNIGGLSEDARRAALRVLDKAQYDLNNSVIDVELKQLSVEFSTIFSPIEGIVVRVDSPFAGVNVTPAQAEFEIINPQTIYFSATADQTDVVNLIDGMNGEITLDPYPDEKIDGTISTISFVPKQDETGTVYKIKVALQNKGTDDRYRFGMTGDIDFTLKERTNTITVPSLYIKTEGNKKYVFMIENNQKIKRYVKTGETFDSTTEIKSGLKTGDVIESK